MIHNVFPHPLFQWIVSAISLHQTPIRFKASGIQYSCPAPVRFLRTQKIFGSISCSFVYLQISWFKAILLLTHDMGRKSCYSLGGTATNRICWFCHPWGRIHRTGHLLRKKFLGIEVHIISHYVICRFSKLVGEGTPSHDSFCSRCFSVVIAPNCFIEPSRKFSCL